MNAFRTFCSETEQDPKVASGSFATRIEWNLQVIELLNRETSLADKLSEKTGAQLIVLRD